MSTKTGQAQRDSRGSGFRLYEGTLTPNDTVEIQLGTTHNGKIALKFLGDDSPVYGFRDGTFEYVVSCRSRYSQNKGLNASSFSIWLTIKDGTVVKIENELLEGF